MLRWIRAALMLARRVRPRGRKPESDVRGDPATPDTRSGGGEPERTGGEDPSTTGPGANETFVGRVSGQDAGYSGRTGAEARRTERHG
jgi:hypothetical protein